MAFHEVGRPVLPFLKELAQCLMSMGIAVATEELTGGGRRTPARIEKRDIHFAAGKRLIDERDITQDDSEGSQTHSSPSKPESPPPPRAPPNLPEPRRAKQSGAQ